MAPTAAFISMRHLRLWSVHGECPFSSARRLLLWPRFAGLGPGSFGWRSSPLFDYRALYHRFGVLWTTKQIDVDQIFASIVFYWPTI